MKTLSKPSDNLGGMLRLWAVPPSSVVSLSEGTLSLSSLDDITRIYMTPESTSAECVLKRSAAGLFYETIVSGFTPRIREEAGELFGEMAGHDFVVVLQDGNGQYLVAGTREEPLHFSFTAKPGFRFPTATGMISPLNGIAPYPSARLTILFNFPLGLNP
jgi:hypothetical protein